MKNYSFGDVEVYIRSIEYLPEMSRRAAEQMTIANLVSEVFGTDKKYAHREDGAPYIEGCDDLYISVSHSREVAVLAVAPYPIGIDIEEPRQQLIRIAKKFLSEQEYSSLSQENGQPTTTELLRAWTIKEAAFKALPGETLVTTIPLPPTKLYEVLYSEELLDFAPKTLWLTLVKAL